MCDHLDSTLLVRAQEAVIEHEPLITSGWTTEHELDGMASPFEQWGREPDTFLRPRPL